MSTEKSQRDAAETKRATTELQPYKDPQVLEELYIEDGHTQAEIGDFYNIDQSTVSYWLDKYGIEREERDLYRSESDDGRIQYTVPEEETRFYQYQLNALLDYGTNEVFNPFTHVHHLMAGPYAVDLPANLRVMNRKEHLKSHAQGTAVDPPSTILQFYFEDDPDDYAYFGSKEERLEDWERLKEKHGIGDVDRGGE